MKRQIKKLNTFNRKLQAMSDRINKETKFLTSLKPNEINEDEFDDIDLLWNNLEALCEDVIRYNTYNI